MNNKKNIKFSISDFFEKDHDRIDVLFRDYLKLKHLNFAEAKKNFVAFKHGLEKHIAREKDILFPVFQRKTGITEGPILVLEEEHRQILRMLQQINLRIQKNDVSSNRTEHDLIVILGQHNVKEENVLYPVLDHLLTVDEKADLLMKLQNMTENTTDIFSAAS